MEAEEEKSEINAPARDELESESEEEVSMGDVPEKDTEVAEFDDTYLAIEGDFELDLKLISRIPCPYIDIISEFADVEVLMISIDSMLLELTAHTYHNWILGGQTIVLAEQINRFLNSLEDLDAKFKLVWFSDLLPLYQQDAYLTFLHPFVIAYLRQSKWGRNVECFRNPMDEKWLDYLRRLTPSFLIMSLDNARREDFVSKEIDFASRFISIAIQLLSSSIPVVLFNAFTVGFSSVMAYRLSTIPISIKNMGEKISRVWSGIGAADDQGVDRGIQSDFGLTQCTCAAEFWACIIAAELERGGVDEEFEKFCCALLLSTLICAKQKTNRSYPSTTPSKGPSPATNNGRRRLQNAAALVMADAECLRVPLEDIWDGRMIMAIHQRILGGEKVLPFRLQEEFAALHQKARLKFSLPTDMSDALMDPPSPQEVDTLLIEECTLYPVEDSLLRSFIPDMDRIFTEKRLVGKHEQDIAHAFEAQRWEFRTIDDKLIEFNERKPPTDPRELKKYYRQKSNLSRWYQNFADSLEGRGNDLLVDFSRVTTAAALDTIPEDETLVRNGAATKKEQAEKGKQKKGGKAKEPQLSKKELILKANREASVKKQVDGDKIKISFAAQVKPDDKAITELDAVFRRLELGESKALCMCEKVKKQVEMFSALVQRFESIDQKREAALDLVAACKCCLQDHWDKFSEDQKDMIKAVWIGLGFGKRDDSSKRLAINRHFNLDINVIYYQLRYGGRIIDVQSDSQKDPRVTGFNPDGWQREMLNAVDQGKSALIIAPTSAGKTFVSYYCVEKVLRKSDEDVVFVGSVYARFRNKHMYGGKVLYGTYSMEWGEDCMNCQVLITIPECFEIMLTSPDPRVQQFCSRIRYVILDEVHSINATLVGLNPQGHVWEHLFMLIRCPFLALSATVENVEVFHRWLQSVEDAKALDGQKPNEVVKITYDERWSELELSISKMEECPPEMAEFYRLERELFYEGKLAQVKYAPETEDASTATFRSTPARNEKLTAHHLLQHFNPYGVYQAEKIRLFGIPQDQKLTARQTLELYSLMAEVDPSLKEELEPCKFFNYDAALDEPSKRWLTRKQLRGFEDHLRARFLEWLDKDPKKSEAIFKALSSDISDEFAKRTLAFNMRLSAMHNILAVLDELRQADKLPALCFNDDRYMCEQLAIRVFSELERREEEFKKSSDYSRLYNEKAEERAEKLERRRRDEKEKKPKTKKKTSKDEEGGRKSESGRYEKEDERDEVNDGLALQRRRLEAELERFKLRRKAADDDLYKRTMERLTVKSQSKDRRGSTTINLMRLIERGIGYHHDGMTSYERGSVEILFRAGYLGIVFSTSTLALGEDFHQNRIKVLFGIDTPKLTPLQFRQMSGRAGRRGFDPVGEVVLMSLPTSKIRRLLTASLATLRGNIPYTTAFTLHLLNYVKGEKGRDSQAALKTHSSRAVLETTDVTKEAVRERAALALLQSPFALHTIHEHVKDDESRVAERLKLKRFLQFVTLFNIQHLRAYQLIDETCTPRGFAQIACFLRSFESSGLLFTVLLRSGIFHRMLMGFEQKTLEERNELKLNIVNILAHLFTNKLCWYYDNEEGETANLPALKPLPEQVAAKIESYNSEVEKLFKAFIQLSSPDLKLQSPVFDLTGKVNPRDLSIYNSPVVSAFDEDLDLRTFIPAAAESVEDHRGRKVYRNSYAVEFWKYGDKARLLGHNKLLIQEIWYLCNDFNKALLAIAKALQVTTIRGFSSGSLAQEQRISPDFVANVFIEIAREFNQRFRKAFRMGTKDEGI